MRDTKDKINLWEQVGNMCLKLAKKELERETVPTGATVETVERLIRIAISIDALNLRWANQNQYGAEVFSGLLLERQGGES